MGPLPPEAEGVEELVVDALYDLADGGHPAPQSLGPVLLAGVAFGRVDDVCPVVFEPPPMVLGALEALVGYVRSRGSRTHTEEPLVRLSPHGEESLRQLLVGGGSGRETEAGNAPRGIDRSEQAKALVPSQAVRPTDVGIPSQPSCPTPLGVPDRHRRAIQGLVRALLCLCEKARQVQGESLDELGTGAHQAVELRAVGQSREGIPQLGVGVAVEVPLAVEAAPTRKDGEGDDFTCAEGGLGTGLTFRRAGLAKVVDRDVKCGEEGVHVEHEESVPFPRGSGSKPTLERGHLPLKSSSYNSHQAFKDIHPEKEIEVHGTRPSRSYHRPSGRLCSRLPAPAVPFIKRRPRRIAVPGRLHLLSPQSLPTIGAMREREASRKAH